MKLSDKTLTFLKNFASVNSGVVLKPGKVQRTISPEKTILVEAILQDEIPTEFGIYDLNQFLGNISLIANHDLSFEKDHVQISGTNLKRGVTFRGCASNLIIVPPEKELKLAKVDVSFKLTNNVLSLLLKLASISNLPNLSVIGKDGELLLRMHERTNDTSNLVEEVIGDYAGDDFTATFKTENLKLLPDDYSVEIQSGAFAKFVNETNDLKYFIALESGK